MSVSVILPWGQDGGCQCGRVEVGKHLDKFPRKGKLSFISKAKYEPVTETEEMAISGEGNYVKSKSM